MQLFSYIPCSDWDGGLSPLTLATSLPLPLQLGERLCMFPLLWWEIDCWTECPPHPPTTTLVSRGVEWWGHLFKETFYYNKVYFHKSHAGLYLG